MRIAIATDGSLVAQHFGRCPEYTIIDVNDGVVTSRMVVPNPGHESGFLPKYLTDMGVSCVIAGGMGSRARELFDRFGVRTIAGASGTVSEVIEAYLRGTLKEGESACDH